ncbi:hypothetical protein DID88_000428 [Monilinia fructigena]|uniref:Uncharacterized protein n=1 Tax=Monilinia fructigena TaxID=38457 RepID=A0A395IN42_9HELO|nr:hypothetical protein DID88_000428 [Monilinia fructigena]
MEYNANNGMTWPDLANMMQRDMDYRGLTRRNYTGNMLYEHWYQTVKKKWGEVEAQRIRASAPREAREPSPPSGPMKSSSRVKGPSGPYNTKILPSASNYPQVGGFTDPESQYTGLTGPQMALGHYYGPPMVSDPRSRSQSNIYIELSDAPYLTHARCGITSPARSI